MSEELKPCPNPWCESDPESDPEKTTFTKYGALYHEVYCRDCGLHAPCSENEARAVEIWNTRALPKVKPLEWKLGTMGYYAVSIIGRYETYASVKAPHWLWRGENGVSIDQYEGKEDSNEAAQAAAQADYERRILAALETGGETK